MKGVFFSRDLSDVCRKLLSWIPTAFLKPPQAQCTHPHGENPQAASNCMPCAKKHRLFACVWCISPSTDRTVLRPCRFDDIVATSVVICLGNVFKTNSWGIMGGLNDVGGVVSE